MGLSVIIIGHVGGEAISALCALAGMPEEDVVGMSIDDAKDQLNVHSIKEMAVIKAAELDSLIHEIRIQELPEVPTAKNCIVRHATDRKTPNIRGRGPPRPNVSIYVHVTYTTLKNYHQCQS